MKKILDNIEKKFFKSYIKKKFNYGTLNRNFFDNLNVLEKFLFKIENFLERKAKERKAKEKKESYVFRSFYDESMGLMITSLAQKRAIEKKFGVTYMSNYERIDLTKEVQKNIKKKRIEKHRKAVRNIIDNIQRGYSY